MLCKINIKRNLPGPGDDCVFEVPDALFMAHIAMYGTLKPEQMSDKEFQSCTWVGLRSSMKYVGPADDTTNNRKEEK